MKKIILASALVISTTFAFDGSSAAGSVGSALGITAESVGKQLTDIVKAKSPATAAQAKSLCTQASTYKSFVGIKDDGLMAKAINICAEKSSEGLEGKVDEVKEKVTTETVKSTPSLMDSASKLLGN
jgi:hypothetical protein